MAKGRLAGAMFRWIFGCSSCLLSDFISVLVSTRPMIVESELSMELKAVSHAALFDTRLDSMWRFSARSWLSS